MSANDYPVHSQLDVLDGKTISKNEEWWKAAILYERYGRKIGVYLWHKEDGDWKRKQKYVVRSLDDWTKDRAAIEGLLPKLEGDVDTDDGSVEASSEVNELVEEAMEN